MKDHSFFGSILSKHIAPHIRIDRSEFVSGGCINDTVCVHTSEGPFFVKWNGWKEKDLFEKEAKGLRLIAEKSPLAVPQVLGSGEQEGRVYLILEWIEKGSQTGSFWEDFGSKLALQHQESNESFGLTFDNHIGRLYQSNTWHDDWVGFFIGERIEPQLRLGMEKGLIGSEMIKDFDVLFRQLDRIIPKEKPAFLHGDLWSGNFLCGPGSRAFLIDPAIYYGHREIELAFTRLFGGFDPLFYEGYEARSPLAPGFEDRVDLHNLYPLLVHVNLFGPSYLSGIRSTLKRFV